MDCKSFSCCLISLDSDEHLLDLPYQCVQTFLQDQALMQTIMSDGPL